MRKRLQVDEPDRLERFMNNRNSYSEELKCLTLKLISSGKSIEEVSLWTGVSQPTPSEWIQAWNKKRAWLSQPARAGWRGQKQTQHRAKGKVKNSIGQKRFLDAG